MKPGGARRCVAATALLGASCIAFSLPFTAVARAADAALDEIADPAPTTVVGSISLADTPTQGAVLLGKVDPNVRSLTLNWVPVRVAPDGGFIIGFGRDAPPHAALRAVLPDGRVLDLPLSVAPRARKKLSRAYHVLPSRAKSLRVCAVRNSRKLTPRDGLMPLSGDGGNASSGRSRAVFQGCLVRSEAMQMVKRMIPTRAWMWRDPSGRSSSRPPTAL